MFYAACGDTSSGKPLAAIDCVLLVPLIVSPQSILGPARETQTSQVKGFVICL